MVAEGRTLDGCGKSERFGLGDNPGRSNRNPRQSKPHLTMLKSIRSNSAFTLIEMLIVVAIIGIIVGIGVPALKDAKTKAINAKASAVQSSVATAKVRYVLDNSADTYDNVVYAHGNAFNALKPYILVNGGTPATEPDLLNGLGSGATIDYGNSTNAVSVTNTGN